MKVIIQKITEEYIMDFEKFKDNVIKEIEQKKELDAADKKSGIYAIYIENFDYKLMEYEPLIIPIYIGQSKDMYARMLSHRKKLKEIFSYTINEFNNNLKTKKEGQYLYHKIRKCINDTNMDQQNIKFKVLEYCNNSDLLEREKYYIDLYRAEDFGFNQLSAIQKIVTSSVENASDKEIIDLLNLISENIKQALIDKSNNYGFSSFNASMLCYNTGVFLGRMERKERSPKTIIKYSEEVIIKFNEILELHGELCEETLVFLEPGIPDFIEWDLKLKNNK